MWLFMEQWSRRRERECAYCASGNFSNHFIRNPVRSFDYVFGPEFDNASNWIHVRWEVHCLIHTYQLRLEWMVWLVPFTVLLTRSLPTFPPHSTFYHTFYAGGSKPSEHVKMQTRCFTIRRAGHPEHQLVKEKSHGKPGILLNLVCKKEDIIEYTNVKCLVFI